MSWGNEVSSSGKPERRRGDLFVAFLVAACVVLAVLVVLLARENRRLKLALAAPASGQAATAALKVGDCVTPFSLVADSGAKVPVEFGPGRPKTLLLVFSAQCPACARTVPIWNDLFGAGPPPSVQLFGLQIDKGAPSPGSGAPAPPAPRFPVFAAETPRPEALTKIPWVPAAVLLAGDGNVEGVWFGVPTAAQVEELRRGLAASKPAPAGRCVG